MPFTAYTGRAARIVALAAVFGAAAGTAARAADLPTAAAGAPKLEAASLRVDWLFRSYHAPFFLGVAKGWYREAGIDLSLREGSGSGTVVRLIGGNSDTFGFVGADAVLRGVQSGIPVVAVATLMPRSADTMFVLKRSGIARPQQLRGKTIATTPGGTSDALLPAFLAGAGLTAADVSIVPVDAALKAQVLLQGRVDATALVAWVGTDFDAVGGVSAFPFADYGVQVVGYSLAVGTATAESNPDLVARFVAASMRAWTYALAHPEEALAAMAQAGAVKPDRVAQARAEMTAAFKLARPAVPGKPLGTQNEADWEAMQRQLLEYRAIKIALPVTRYMTNRFMQ